MKHVICDLDGVLWRGRVAIPGSGEALARLVHEGFVVTFATNNSTKSPGEVSQKIADVVGHQVGSGGVFTSSMAAARLLESSVATVMTVGEDGIDQAMKACGMGVTDDPDLAEAVVVGLTRNLTYRQLADAAKAVRRGARFVATNDDPTFPTEDGLDPGSGAIVAAIAKASSTVPEIAGKPHAPMVDMLVSAGIAEAWVIGDRLDTDIALASKVDGWEPILVLSGVSTAEEAEREGVAHVVSDIREAVDLVVSTDLQS